MRKFFNFVLNFYSFIFLLLIFVSCMYFHLINSEAWLPSFLRAYLFWNIGIRGLIAFAANTYPQSALIIADSYNWPKNSDLQKELAANHGAVGVLGVLCLWFNGYFWLATLIAGTLTCIISELENLFSIFKGKTHPFAKNTSSNASAQVVEKSYVIGIALFIGMHIDLIVAFGSLAWGLYFLI